MFIYHKQHFSFLVCTKSTGLLQKIDTKHFVIYKCFINVWCWISFIFGTLIGFDESMRLFGFVGEFTSCTWAWMLAQYLINRKKIKDISPEYQKYDNLSTLFNLLNDDKEGILTQQGIIIIIASGHYHWEVGHSKLAVYNVKNLLI